MNLLQEFKNDVAGLALLKDWLGDGGIPVPTTQAEQRAWACTKGDEGRMCHENVEPGWWNKVKSSIANTIKMQLEMKHHLKLGSPIDQSLGMCRVCGCCLRLKRHTPIEHINNHTTPEQLAKYSVWCWIKKEIEK